MVLPVLVLVLVMLVILVAQARPRHGKRWFPWLAHSRTHCSTSEHASRPSLVKLTAGAVQACSNLVVAWALQLGNGQG